MKRYLVPISHSGNIFIRETPWKRKHNPDLAGFKEIDEIEIDQHLKKFNCNSQRILKNLHEAMAAPFCVVPYVLGREVSDFPEEDILFDEEKPWNGGKKIWWRTLIVKNYPIWCTTVGGGHTPLPVWSKDEAIQTILKLCNLGEYRNGAIYTSKPGVVIGKGGKSISPIASFLGCRVDVIKV